VGGSLLFGWSNLLHMTGYTIAALLADQLLAPQELLHHEELSARKYQVMLHLAAGKTLIRTAEEMEFHPVSAVPIESRFYAN
jgi:hypothetical protein